MSTIDGPKITPQVLPNEVSKPTSAEKPSEVVTKATASAPATKDVVESAPAERLWGDNKPATTPPPAPPADSKPAAATDTEVFSENLGLGLDHAKTNDGGSLRSLADDALAAAFMKVNILDPDTSVETRNNMTDALSVLQQQAIKNAKQEIKNAQERIREAQQEASKWGFFRGIMAVAMPQCMLYETFRACGMDQETAFIFSGSFGSGLAEMEQNTAKTDVRMATSEANEASLRWSRGLSNIGLNPNHQNFERWLEGKVAETREETASAGEDGVPTKGLAKKLKPNMAKVLNALAAIGDAGGLEAMLAAAPQVIRDELVPALRKLGVKNPEAIAESIAAAFCEEVIARATGGVSADHALGVATMMLGHKLDTDSKIPVSDDPAEEAARALDAANEATKESPVEKASSFQEPGHKA